MDAELEVRRASAEDAPAFLAHVQAGFDSYVEFAPSSWRPPRVAGEQQRTAQLLRDPETWGVIAFAAGHAVGHVAFVPARERVPGESAADWTLQRRLPGFAHLWQLFVLPEWWGRGIAARLHGAAVAQMGERGFAHARLYTPTQHARARRFYERRGWVAAGEEFNDGLRLLLTEYRLELVPGGR